MSGTMGFFDQVALDAGARRETSTADTARVGAPRGEGVLRVAAFDLVEPQPFGEEQLPALPWHEEQSDAVVSPSAGRLALERATDAVEDSGFRALPTREMGRELAGSKARVAASLPYTEELSRERSPAEPTRVDPRYTEPSVAESSPRPGHQLPSAGTSTSMDADQAAGDAMEAVVTTGAATDRRPATPTVVTTRTLDVDDVAREVAVPTRAAASNAGDPTQGVVPAPPRADVSSSLVTTPSVPAAPATSLTEVGALAAPVPAALRPAFGSVGPAVQRAVAPTGNHPHAPSASGVASAAGLPAAAGAFSSRARAARAPVQAPSVAAELAKTSAVGGPVRSAESRPASALELTTDSPASAPHHAPSGSLDATSLVAAPAARPASALAPQRAGARPEAAEVPRTPSQARPVAAPPPPHLVIGRLDIIVEAPVSPERSAPPQPSAFPDASSALYLRRL